MTHLHANGPLGSHPDSYYAALTPPPAPYAPLRGDAGADLAIVGGGLTGLTAALFAARAGLSVVVLEAARVAWGASGRNGGQVGVGFNWDQRKITRYRGSSNARALWQEALDANSLVRDLIAQHAPEADFRPGVIQAQSDVKGFQAARNYAEWLGIAYGYETEVLDGQTLAARIGSDHYRGGVLDQRCGFCNPLALTLGVARAAHQAGAQIYETTEVHTITATEDHWRVATGHGDVTAKYVLQASNGLSPGLVGATSRRLLPLNNYIAVTAPLERPPMPAPVAVADDRSVVNYFWQTPDGRLLYGGGESYGATFPEDIPERVRANLARVYPDLADVRFDFAWGGTLAVTASRLPYIGQPSPGLFAAGGYSGHGLALAPHAGSAVVEAILGDETRLQRLALLPAPPLPGGRYLGGLITNGAMAYAAWLDRRRDAKP